VAGAGWWAKVRVFATETMDFGISIINLGNFGGIYVIYPIWDLREGEISGIFGVGNGLYGTYDVEFGKIFRLYHDVK
jgi:hypothetical protein